MFSKFLTNAVASPVSIWSPKRPKTFNRVLTVQPNADDSSEDMGSHPNLCISKPFKCNALPKLSSKIEKFWNGEGVARGDDKDIAIARIMLPGNISTRECKFSAFKISGNPVAPDPMEPFNIALAIAESSVEYSVLMTADRDDLLDGGSGHIAQTVRAIKELKPETWVECFSPDFQGDLQAVSTLAHSGIDVFAHNIETVKRLQSKVRDPRAGYDQSLSILKHAKLLNKEMRTKAIIMLGHGETVEEVKEAMSDLRAIGVDILAIGRSFSVTQSCDFRSVIGPSKFPYWKEYARSIGFQYVATGFLVWLFC